ncbi:MAG: hypothetical protein ACJ746_15290 [Bryobacteraceae bacterium]
MKLQVAICTLLALGTAAAGPPWKAKNPDPAKWTAAEVEQVLSNSPWSQTANAVFPETRDDEPVSAYALPGAAQAGMAGTKGGTDGRWDGGVAKNTGRGQVPTLPLLVRWDSAAPVRQALARSQERTPDENSKDYIITVVGLVSAGKDQPLEGLMSHSSLKVPGKPAISAEDAKVDANTGAVHLYFPRSSAITSSDKDVVFTTRFGSLTAVKKFHLAEMVYQGRLEL